MEHKSCDPICVLKVDVNCCQGCQVKLKKKLLSLNDVLWVDYDSRKKWATVRGRCEPCVLVKCIQKMGKAADVVSYCKDPTKPRTSSVDDKSCHAKGKEKASSASCDDDDNVDESVKDFDESKEKKQHHHMHEDYAPPPKVDESVCKDQFCTIHRRSGMNGYMYWNHPSTRMGPPPSYGQFGMPPYYHPPPPPPQPYGYGGPPPPPPPGVEFNANFFRDANPAGGCNTM